MNAPPPRWLRVLARILPADLRAEALADLDERYRTRVTRVGTPGADRWRRWQAASLLRWSLLERTRRALLAPFSRRVREGALADVRVGLRALRRSPGYTLVAGTTLALGVGVTTAVFSVADAVLLQPLPYPESGDLVAVHETRAGQSWWSASPVNALAWRERAHTFEDVAWTRSRSVSLVIGESEPRQIFALEASSNLLDVLGVTPLLGRDFLPGEDRPGAEAVALLTRDAWQNRFGGAPDVLGSRVSLDGVAHTVVGIVPSHTGAEVLESREVITPAVLDETLRQSQFRVLRVIARLDAGSSFELARQEMSALAEELDALNPEGSRGWGVRLVPLKEQVVGDVQTPLQALAGSVALVLLVACANLGNLLLARGTVRAGELSVRASLGASRARLIRQLLVESAILSLVGGAAGVALAVWGTNAFLALDPTVLPRIDGLAPDLRMLVTAASVVVLTAALFSLVPAVRATRIDLGGALSGSRRGETRGDRRVRSALVAAEVALVVVLLVGAGILMRSLSALAGVDPGFDLEDRLAISVTLPATRYGDADATAAFVSRAVEAARAIPGVIAAGTTTTLPLTGAGPTSFQVVRSLPTPATGEEPIGGLDVVSPGYFETLGIPVLAGRLFDARDRGETAEVLVVDRGVARSIGEPADALADAIRIAPEGAGAIGDWREIVGVVGPVRDGLASEARPRIYVPEGQDPFVVPNRTLVVRTEPGASASVAGELRELVRRLDPALPVEGVRPLEEVAHGSIARSRFQAALLVAFAAVGLALGVVGVYGVVSYAVGRRTREVGLRLAVGASRRGVMGEVVRSAMKPVIYGLLAGVAGAAVASRVLTSFAFGVAPLDPVAFAGGVAILLSAALAAATLPALRASRIDPARALHED